MSLQLPSDLRDLEPSALARRSWRAHLGHETTPPALRAALTAGGSLPAVAEATAARYPDRPALRVEAGWWTHGELAEAIARTASLVGTSSDQRVLLAPTNTSAGVIAYLAVLRAGARVVLANPQYTTEELSRLIDAGSVTMAIASGDAADRLRALRLPVIDLEREGPHPGLLEAARDAPRAPLPNVGGEDIAVIAFTSGTTGEPKAVPLSHAALLASTRGVQLAWRWQPTDVLVHALPLSHQHGLSGVHLAVVSGSATRILPRFVPDRFLDTVVKERATVAFTVPALLERLMDEPTAERLATCRLITCGSAPLPPDLAERVLAACGSLPVERYGSTEAGLNLSNLATGERRPGTVGLALPGVEVAVVDPDLQPVLGDRTGELLVRGPQVFSGYGGTGEGLIEDGWFRTGDLVDVDLEDGWVTIVGRSKDLIISGGMNVHPREVEDALRRLSGVRDASVVGLPSTRWGEEVVAVVVAGEGPLQAEELRQELRDSLAPFKIPKRICFVDAVPRTWAGKVDVGLVRACFDGGDRTDATGGGGMTRRCERIEDAAPRNEPGVAMEVGEPHTTTVEREGVHLHVESCGSGTPVLFVHEFAGDHRSWEPQLRAFARRHRCIVYAARGYPPSSIPVSSQDYSEQHAIDDARAVIGAVADGPVHIVGHSMGGFVALHLARLYPDRCRSITITGVGYGVGEGRRDDYVRDCSAVAERFEQQGASAVAPSYAMGPTRVQFAVKDPRGHATFARMLAEHDGGGSARTLRGVQSHRLDLYELEAEWRALATPLLIVTGDEDEQCLEPSLRLKRWAPGCRLAVIPGGHTLPLEEPELFNRLVGDHLRSVDEGSWRPRDPRSLAAGLTGSETTR